MKTVVAAAILSGILVSVAFGQGTVLFQNVAGGLDAPDYLSDGTTKLLGPQYMAELLGGPTASSLVSIATTPFDSFTNIAGYYLGGTQTIETIGCGATAWVQVNIWNMGTGATFDEARASGLANAWAQSSVFLVQTCCPALINPCIPTTLLGLTPLSLNAAVPIPLLFTTTPGGLILTWRDPSFVLQASTNAAGTYTNILGAVSPYTNSISGPSLYFRLVAN